MREEDKRTRRAKPKPIIPSTKDMDGKNVAERIKTFLRIDGSTVASFAREAGIDASNLKKMLDGEQTITVRTLKKIAEAHGVNRQWLETGEGEMMGKKSPRVAQGLETAYFYNDLPATAGDAEQFPSNEHPSGIIKLQNLHGAKYFFPVVGCSMQPRIDNGDWVGVAEANLDGVVDPDKIYMIVTRDGQRMIKHIAQVDKEKEQIMCASDNAQFQPFHISFSVIAYIYQVVCCLKVC